MNVKLKYFGELFAEFEYDKENNVYVGWSFFGEYSMPTIRAICKANDFFGVFTRRELTGLLAGLEKRYAGIAVENFNPVCPVRVLRMAYIK